MAVTKPTRFWEAKPKRGRKPKWSDPKELHAACVEYFQWCEDNPLAIHKVIVVAGDVQDAFTYKVRPFTLFGLCGFLGLSDDTWNRYRSKEELCGVTKDIDKAIYDQKFIGAATEQFNANIIARDLGLADKKEIKQKSVTIEITNDMSAEDAAKAYQDLMGD